jgi:hypothetical protein
VSTDDPAQVVLVVDIANVMGSRPDGWWRDRAAAAARLLVELQAVVDAEVTGPRGVGAVRVAGVCAVLEGAARNAVGPDPESGGRGSAAVTVVRADRDGDSEIVVQAQRLALEGSTPLVVTADRGLRARLPEAALVAGPGWLHPLLGR